MPPTVEWTHTSLSRQSLLFLADQLHLLLSERFGLGLPASLDLNTVDLVLDVACGTANWAQDMAFTYQVIFYVQASPWLRHLVLIAVVAQEDLAAVQHALARVPLHYLVKPFRVQELLPWSPLWKAGGQPRAASRQRPRFPLDDHPSHEQASDRARHL